MPEKSEKPDKTDETTKLAWFELRYGAERAVKSFRAFNDTMKQAIEQERDRFIRERQEAKARAEALEAEYQAWRTAKIASDEPKTRGPRTNTSTMCVCGENRCWRR